MPSGDTGVPRLNALPPGFAATREALHAVAEQIVAPARKPQNEISLRQVRGGFGTPPFEHDGEELQVRVDGAELVLDKGAEESRAEITSLKAAGDLVSDLLPDGPPDDDTPLDIDPASARALADFYAFGGALFAVFRDEAGDDTTTSLLWPEHFDLAIEAGSDGDGKRANYGASPGDENHPEPYIYVGPQTAKVSGDLWNAEGFPGAELGHAEIAAAADQIGLALDFIRTRKQALDAL